MMDRPLCVMRLKVLHQRKEKILKQQQARNALPLHPPKPAQMIASGGQRYHDKKEHLLKEDHQKFFSTDLPNLGGNVLQAHIISSG